MKLSDLYRLHTNPHELYGYNTADDLVPEIFWPKYESNLIELRKRESALAKSPQYSYLYARLSGKPFPIGEDMIATNAMYSYKYARHILKDRFPKGEQILSKSANWSYEYASRVIKGKWPEGEETILNHGNSQNYKYLLKRTSEEL